VWLDREEQSKLLYSVDEQPDHKIAFGLGLNGLRTDEIVDVSRSNLRPLGEKYSLLTVEDGKTGKREVPIREDLASTIRTTANARGLSQHEDIISVSKRSIRNWMSDARAILGCDELGMHDLRRTWATDTYYSLAADGNPIAQELTMSWGGWVQNPNGRQTFRENYLGPVPDHIAEQAANLLFDRTA
jgi:integrase